MCSQPPALVNEPERTEEHLELIRLIDPVTSHLGITGGEPTLFKEGFLRLLEECKLRLPNTQIHVLTNGRSFIDRSFAIELAAIRHPGLTLGIPLYADVDHTHDYVVQVRGAFQETVHGIYNLAEADVSIEIRNVLSRVTVERLGRWSEYLGRNMTFVRHVALMGLEMTGFVHRNIAELWIDPFDYQEQLERSVWLLNTSGLDVSIYNHPLCVLPKGLWRYAAKSISDWKNVYLDICEECVVKESCGGFFQSSTKKHSKHILPIRSGELIEKSRLIE